MGKGNVWRAVTRSRRRMGKKARWQELPKPENKQLQHVHRYKTLHKGELWECRGCHQIIGVPEYYGEGPVTAVTDAPKPPSPAAIRDISAVYVPESES